MKQKRKTGSSDDEVKRLHPKKRGQPVLGASVELQLQSYLKKICKQGGGGIVTASVVVAAARGILFLTDHSEFGGYIE